MDSGDDPSKIQPIRAGRRKRGRISKDTRGTQMGKGRRVGTPDAEDSSDWTSGSDPSDDIEGAPKQLPEEDLDDLVAAIAAIASQELAPAETDKGFCTSRDLELRLTSLSESDTLKLNRMKVPGVHGGKLTVLGHLCVSKSCPKDLSRFLLSRADVNSSEVLDDHHIPLLHLAAFCGNEAVVELLCAREDVNFFATNSTNLNALHMGVKSGSEDTFRCIYTKAYDRLRHPELLPKTCAFLSPLVNGKDDLGMTPLHYAAMEGQTSMVEGLLQADTWYTQYQPWCNIVDVNASNNSGFTALHLASRHNHRGIVNALLKHRNIDTTRRSCRPMPIAEPDSEGYVQDSKIERMESRLRQFCAAGQSCLSPTFAEELKEQKRWGHENRERADQLLFPGTICAANHDRLTALHCAASKGHITVVADLVKKMSRQGRARITLNAVDGYGMTALHHAVVGGDSSMVEEILSSPKVKGNVREERRNLTPLNMAYLFLKGEHLKGMEAEDRLDFLQEYQDMIGLLSEKKDVKAYTENLYRDRQLYVDAANALLVGAALIASITFAGWLSPPLGYQQYYETSFLLTGSAAPDTYASYAAVGQHVSVQVFWIFNSLSFFFSIATVLIGACVVLPMVGKSELEMDVLRMRRLHIWTTLALSLCVLFVLGAFVAAGFASLPPKLEYQWGMIVTTVTGGFAGLGSLTYYLYRVVKLIKSI